MAAVKEGHLANLNLALEEHEQVWQNTKLSCTRLHLSGRMLNCPVLIYFQGVHQVGNLPDPGETEDDHLPQPVQEGHTGPQEPPDQHTVLHHGPQADGGEHLHDDRTMVIGGMNIDVFEMITSLLLSLLNVSPCLRLTT